MRRTALDFIAMRTWFIEPDALQKLVAIGTRELAKLEDEAEHNTEALAARVGRPLDNARRVELREGGVAVIPIAGPIFAKANLFTEISGATSTQILARDFREALDNPQVRAVVFDISSPGGATEGVHEFAEMIYAARGRKPIVAYVGHMAASAAYWIAAACDRIVIDATALLGSIGVVSQIEYTPDGDNAKTGARRITVVSAVSPKKRLDPGTTEGRAEAQSVVDSIAQVFVDRVAAFRNISAEKILSDFGQGGVLVGAAAKAAGMADQLGSLESLIAELAGSASKSTVRSLISMSQSKGAITVATTAELRAALTAGHVAEEITIAQADNSAAIAAARADGEKDGVAKERKRILDIQALAVPGFEAEVSAQIDSGASVGDASQALLKAQKDRGVSLASMRSESTAVPHTTSAQPTKAARAVRASSIYESRAKAMTGK